MELKYGVKVFLLSSEDGGGYLIEVPDLPGCTTHGSTLEEALGRVDSTITLWLKAAEETGKVIPQPRFYEDDEPSGKFTVRVPKQLHKELNNIAEEQGVSLNQLVNYYLSKGVGNDIACSLTKTDDCPKNKVANNLEQNLLDSAALTQLWRGNDSFRRFVTTLPTQDFNLVLSKGSD
ncbi:toxin-antitoxin system HicB family antitoxin [Anaerospora sp.]|uniref:toxin-antitoxin system HicB family antitoxin n=1 Tax=Anaerospora sp. TaxID=1960278 RepID=UPI00289A204D|nr:toxin-antitoxin system HicB family antitoxin [Anaerospora sp.]